MAGLMSKIRLEKWVSTRTANGWAESVTKYNVWAEVLSSSSSKANAQGRTAINQTKQFKVRFRPDFKPTGNWKLTYEGKRYSVNSIEKENEKRFYWVITAEARGN